MQDDGAKHLGSRSSSGPSNGPTHSNGSGLVARVDSIRPGATHKPCGKCTWPPSCKEKDACRGLSLCRVDMKAQQRWHLHELNCKLPRTTIPSTLLVHALDTIACITTTTLHNRTAPAVTWREHATPGCWGQEDHGVELNKPHHVAVHVMSCNGIGLYTYMQHGCGHNSTHSTQSLLRTADEAPKVA